MHVAVREGNADDKGYCYCHSENAALAGYLSQAIGATVWAHCYSPSPTARRAPSS
jgi:hypothetical protein